MAHDYKPDCGLKGKTFTTPSLVRVEFAVECDLKNIIQKFLRTGQLPDSRNPSGIVDATRLPSDFMELQNKACSIRQAFDALPLEERNRYNNDPLAWLDAESKDTLSVKGDAELDENSEENTPPDREVADSSGSGANAP